MGTHLTTKEAIKTLLQTRVPQAMHNNAPDLFPRAAVKIRRWNVDQIKHALGGILFLILEYLKIHRVLSFLYKVK